MKLPLLIATLCFFTGSVTWSAEEAAKAPEAQQAEAPAEAVTPPTEAAPSTDGNAAQVAGSPDTNASQQAPVASESEEAAGPSVLLPAALILMGFMLLVGFVVLASALKSSLASLAEKIKSKTLFITHYPLLATKLQSKFPMYIQNLHMGYDVELCINGGRRITFLYKVMPGLATGLW